MPGWLARVGVVPLRGWIIMAQFAAAEDRACSAFAVRAFADNYIWLIRGRPPEHVAIVDPGDPEPVVATLERERLRPVAILCTHHHGDHVGGAYALAARYGIPVYGPARERIRAITHHLEEGDRIELEELELTFTVFEVPGHTAGHIAYYGHGMLFCGDTLFSAGCGRLFEGTAAQMYASLTRLAALPEDTKVYCAHEYTLANLRFALAVEPGNHAARNHLEACKRLRARDFPTLPSTIGRERQINPFLRVRTPMVRAAAQQWCRHATSTHRGMEISSRCALDSDVEVFAVLRRWKDNFRG